MCLACGRVWVRDTFGGLIAGPVGAEVSSQGREPLESGPYLCFSPVGAADGFPGHQLFCRPYGASCPCPPRRDRTLDTYHALGYGPLSLRDCSPPQAHSPKVSRTRSLTVAALKRPRPGMSGGPRSGEFSQIRNSRRTRPNRMLGIRENCEKSTRSIDFSTDSLKKLIFRSRLSY